VAELLAGDLRRGVHARKVMDSYKIRKAEALAERFEQRDYCAELHRLRGGHRTQNLTGSADYCESFADGRRTIRLADVLGFRKLGT
jgi:hypothetical protein